MIALIQIDNDRARIFLENLLRLRGRAVALGAETQLVARSIPDEGRNRTVLRRDERPSRANKGHQEPSRDQEPSRAIKSHQEPSRFIKSHQASAIKSHQEPSRAIKSHQEPSRAIKSHQDSSRAIKSHQEIKSHQAPSGAVPDAKPVLDDDVREPLFIHEDECLPNKAIRNHRRESVVRCGSQGLSCPKGDRN